MIHTESAYSYFHCDPWPESDATMRAIEESAEPEPMNEDVRVLLSEPEQPEAPQPPVCVRIGAAVVGEALHHTERVRCLLHLVALQLEQNRSLPVRLDVRLTTIAGAGSHKPEAAPIHRAPLMYHDESGSGAGSAVPRTHRAATDSSTRTAAQQALLTSTDRSASPTIHRTEHAHHLGVAWLSHQLQTNLAASSDGTSQAASTSRFITTVHTAQDVWNVSGQSRTLNFEAVRQALQMRSDASDVFVVFCSAAQVSRDKWRFERMGLHVLIVSLDGKFGIAHATGLCARFRGAATVEQCLLDVLVCCAEPQVLYGP